MRAIPTNCPGCNSIQKFVPYSRPERPESDILAVTISCKMCRRSFKLYRTTAKIQEMRKKASRYAANAATSDRAGRMVRELAGQIRLEALRYGLDEDPLVPHHQLDG